MVHVLTRTGGSAIRDPGAASLSSVCPAGVASSRHGHSQSAHARVSGLSSPAHLANPIARNSH